MLCWSALCCYHQPCATLCLLHVTLCAPFSLEAISIPPPPNPVVPAPLVIPMRPASSTPASSAPASPADGFKTTGATLAGSVDAKTAISSRGGSPKAKRKDVAASEPAMPLNDNYIPIKLTRKVLEQRNMTYVLAADAALGDGSIRTNNDLTQWGLVVLAAMALAPSSAADPPAIDEAEAAADAVLPEPAAQGTASADSPADASLPPATNIFNPQDASLALAALKAKFKNDRATSSDSFSRDRSNTVTSTRARVGSASQAVRQRVAQVSTPPSTREGSTHDLVREACLPCLPCLLPTSGGRTSQACLFSLYLAYFLASCLNTKSLL